MRINHRWLDATLSAEDRVTLANWLAQHGYLGRADSWCEARLLPDQETETRLGEINTLPLGTRTAELGMEIVRRLIQRNPELSGVELDSIAITSLMENGVFGLGPQNRRPIEFKRSRQKREDDGGRRLSGSFRIAFPKSVTGPIALGHPAHFGLGLFTPILP